ncbi:tautomerase family protein [Kitasatospora herbaricolor]|uniref:Tautomerase family protein n=1 Tax=Kitasatospora herbaricolor TaxID=68217 RepID=A0ABZ1WJX2_9ACTN|nr:tautomerase family protein [Kitasatospora herbaricolor]
MPIVNVTTWPNQSDEKCRELIEELTLTVNRVTGAPFDKITVFIQEIAQNRWGEGGVLGTDPGFPELSRRRTRPADTTTDTTTDTDTTGTGAGAAGVGVVAGPGVVAGAVSV